ncbi:DUF1778 domain-containing protein [Myxococcota bacterium]|nr:DUF1778 domain-containing protein [Myxococcota bacterium]
MARARKATQLQIRVSEAQKDAIRRAADRAGRDVSAFVLDRVLPPTERLWQDLLDRLEGEELDRFALAELADLLASLEPAELAGSLETPPAAASSLVRNYLAAMVEQACAASDVRAPAWTRMVEPLERPWFGSQLQSLRLHLLRSSPAPFRRRNIFIDTAMGGRV